MVISSNHFRLSEACRFQTESRKTKEARSSQRTEASIGRQRDLKHGNVEFFFVFMPQLIGYAPSFVNPTPCAFFRIRCQIAPRHLFPFAYPLRLTISIMPPLFLILDVQLWFSSSSSRFFLSPQQWVCLLSARGQLHQGRTYTAATIGFFS